MQNNYLEKVYSGILGKAMGVILGAPVEPTIWTYEKIQETYGNITNYVKKFKNFAADDDLNGPIFFLKALDLVEEGEEFCATHVGRAWLNYAREGIGMFWWGGYGTSTEHTAFLNLKNNIDAPQSGSKEVNGLAIAEQIGGQIFIDTWGLIFPGDCEKAAQYAEYAASVSHDKNGIYGARFVAACIAKAFVCDEIKEIMEAGLETIPVDCEYRRVCDAVIDFYNNDTDKDFRKCRQFLTDEFGYDRYPGVCHIIPNSGVMILAMLYAEGDFARTIEIATMCGWDTDCNAGNVGTILGVMNGYDALAEKYRTQINDAIVASSSVGSLNIIDMPTLAKEIANYGYKLSGEEVPANIAEILENKRNIIFDFEIEGSTHGFKTSNDILFPVSHSKGTGIDGTNSLVVLLDRIKRGQNANIYYKPFYRREDFDDERYQPAFSPQVYAGQKVEMKIYLDKWNGDDIGVNPYVRLSHSKKILKGKIDMINAGEWIEIEFTIPDTGFEPIDEVGLNIESHSRAKNKVLGKLHIDGFKITDKGYHRIDFAKEKTEFGTTTQFTQNGGSFAIEDGYSHMITNDDAIALTGNYYMKDIECSMIVVPEFKQNHLVAFRSQGIKKGYLAGFYNGKLTLLKNNFGYTVLVETDFEMELGKEYKISVEAVKGEIKVSVDNMLKIVYTDNDFLEFGCLGYSTISGGRMRVKNIEFREI